MRALTLPVCGHQIWGIHVLRKPRVLCIDRYPSLLPTVEHLLANEGYQVLTACTVEDGLSRLAKNQVDAVVLDYTLCCHDHRSSTCLANQFQTLQPGVKLLVWCADDSIFRDQPPCADAFFMKPVDPTHLLKRLNSLLRS
jgi:CheY-like chemotaxis protein